MYLVTQCTSIHSHVAYKFINDPAINITLKVMDTQNVTFKNALNKNLFLFIDS